MACLRLAALAQEEQGSGKENTVAPNSLNASSKSDRTKAKATSRPRKKVKITQISKGEGVNKKAKARSSQAPKAMVGKSTSTKRPRANKSTTKDATAEQPRNQPPLAAFFGQGRLTGKNARRGEQREVNQVTSEAAAGTLVSVAGSASESESGPRKQEAPEPTPVHAPPAELEVMFFSDD